MMTAAKAPVTVIRFHRGQLATVDVLFAEAFAVPGFAACVSRAAFKVALAVVGSIA